MANITNADALALEQLYIAYFGRAAEPGSETSGFGYWSASIANGKDTLANIANEFSNSAESKALYSYLGNTATSQPTSVEAENFVNQVYLNLYGRDADQAGLDYFVSRLTSTNGGDVIYGIANGAQGNDLTLLQNKRQAALNYTTTHTDATYVASESLAAAGGTSILTVGADAITANEFQAPRGWTPGGTDQINTLNDDDSLTGVGSNPTLELSFVDDADTGITLITPTLTNIETIDVDVIGTTAKTLDLQDASGVRVLNVSRINNTNYTTQNIQAAVESISVNNTNAPGNSVAFLHIDSALNGANNSLELTLNNANVNVLRVEAATAGIGYETINLHSNGSANTATTLQVEDVATLNISGSQNLTIGAFANAAGSLTRIDGSTATGNLSLNLNGVLSATADGTSGTNVPLVVLTGTGADTIFITQDTIGTTDSINTGDGSDTVNLRSAVTNNFTPATTGAALVTNAENLSLTRTANPAAGASTVEAANLTVDMARFSGDQVTTMTNLGDNLTVKDGVATFILNNMTAGDAAGMRIIHSSTLNNAIADTVIQGDVDAAVTTVGVAIVEGTNNDPRFNFTLNADSDGVAANVTNTVVNVTLTDSDTESNSVLLGQVARHTGTLTVNTGTVGTFMNMDATAVVGYNHNLTGAVGDATTLADAAVETRDAAVTRNFIQGGAGQTSVFSSVAASGYVGNLEVRLGVSNTGAQLGTGDDTIIFADRAGISVATAGLTIQDTIAGGAGTDTIVLDGTGVQTLGASEWTNLTGVDVLRLAGVAGGTFNIRVTDQLVDQSDSGSRLTIINNDGDLKANLELTANIDLRAMGAANAVTFVGNNSDLAATTVQTVILNDVTANGNNILNGGDNGALSEYVLNGRDFASGAGATFATQAAADAQYLIDAFGGVSGNDNVLQIFNTAEVTVGDLVNSSNFSTIQFRNDAASLQTLNLTLNDAVVDALVDSNHTATATQFEVLTINALDNIALPLVLSAMNVQAGTVGAQFMLDVTGAGGADTIVAGAGADAITGGAGADRITGGTGADRVNYTAAGTDANVSNIGAAGDNTSAVIVLGTSITSIVGTTFGANAGVVVTQTSAVEVITDIAVGDVISLGNAAIAAWTTNNNLGTGAAVDQQAVVVSGTYNGVTGLFTAAAGGVDSVIMWDSDATVGTEVFNSVVLVGVTSAEAGAATIAAGVVTF